MISSQMQNDMDSWALLGAIYPCMYEEWGLSDHRDYHPLTMHLHQTIIDISLLGHFLLELMIGSKLSTLPSRIQLQFPSYPRRVVYACVRDMHHMNSSPMFSNRI